MSVLAQTWHNPMELSEEWSLYGIGDPYLLKYNGEYYLYCSTRDDMTGVKCWMSRDLVNWNYQGLVTTEAITKGAYAPEVIYYNGSFYMYTSPAGNGHYVLKSDSPTGPFTVVTGNIGNSIDGSVFIEDDGSLYFYRAGTTGIFGHSMSSPTSIGSAVQINAYMNGWTEAPSVIKRNGTYYIQYTGNHVISPGYRIDHGRSKTGPLAGFEPFDEFNPYIICTEGDVKALGHGSLFIGPDLDSYYVTYHNKVRSYNTGPLRHLNFDRVAWNGELLLTQGPTTFDKPVPEMPDFYDYFDVNSIGDLWQTINGTWQIGTEGVLTQNNLSETNNDILLISDAPDQSFTAEFNVQTLTSNGSESNNGIVFNYIDENNYGLILLNAYSKTVTVNIIEDGVWGTAITKSLNGVVDLYKWNTVRIEKNLDQVKVFINNMLKAEITDSFEGGKLGLISHASETNYDYCAFSNKVNGSGIYDAYKSIPGKIEAIHYNETNGFNEVNLSGSVNFRGDNVQVTSLSQGTYALGSVTTGNWYDYNLNVGYEGNYAIGIKYASNSECIINFSNSEGVLSDDIVLPSTGGTYTTFVTDPIYLSQGLNTIKMSVVSGQAAFYRFTYEKWESVTTYADSFTSSFNNWNYEGDGIWDIVDKTAQVTGTGKRAVGNTAWGDYAVEVDVKYINDWNAGLIFRVKNPAMGGTGNDPQLGADFLQGYYVNITSNGAYLGKQNYNWKGLVGYSGANHTLNEWYHLKAEVKGANIKIYIDDMENPVIDYTDDDPFITGKVGLRSFYTTANFDNFEVHDIDSESSAINEDVCFSIISCFSDKVIAVNPENTSEVTQKSFNENDLFQQWKFDKTSSYWSIINKGSGKYLTVNDLGDVVTADYSQSPLFYWQVSEEETGRHSIENLSSKNYLLIDDGQTIDGASILQGTYDGSEEHLWKFKYLYRDDVSTGIESDNSLIFSLEIVPNPAVNYCDISLSHPIQSVKIFDLKGVSVDCYDGNKLKTVRVNCENYKKGIYIVCVKSGDSSIRQKLVVL